MKKTRRFCSTGLQKTRCLACLSVDRKLYKLLEFKGVFKLICKDVVQGIHSEIFLCFECLALLRNVKKFQEKVQKSQNILKSYKQGDVENNLLENLSNLSTTKADILDCSNPVDYDEAKANLDIKPEEEDFASDDFNTLDDDETLGDANIDNSKPKGENYISDDFNTFDDDETLGDANIDNSKPKEEDSDDFNTFDDDKTLEDANIDNSKPKEEDYISDDFNTFDDDKTLEDTNIDNSKPKEEDYISDDFNTFDDDKTLEDTNIDNSKPKEEDYISDDFNTFDDDKTLGDAKIDNPPETNLNKPALATKVNTNEEYIEDEMILKDEHVHKIEGKDPHSASIFMPSDKNVVKKGKRRYFLSKDRSELYKFVCPKKTLANVYQTLKIPFVEINYWLEKERNSSFFKRVLYKCEKCARRMSKKKLQEHKRRHRQYSKSSQGHYTCDYCSLSFKKKVSLINHLNKHCYIRCCNFCGFKCIGIANMYAHVKKEHGTRAVQCLQCQTNFRNTRLFYEHYHKDHYELSKTFICDYCNKKCSSRRVIEKHIFNNHLTHPCTKCSLTFPTPLRLKYHYALKHSVSRSEASYCVKCDKQFDNLLQFRNHLKYAVAHREENKTRYLPPSKQKIKCLACPNMYAKRYNMMNHYNKVHVGMTKHYCADCNKMFSDSTYLKDHIKYYHEGHERPKNHICSVCGRGFTEKNVLTNHMRTHTGERPFECPHCDSKFAQKTAMLTHVKKIHRNM